MSRETERTKVLRTVVDAGIIAGTLERIDNRAMAADGPVTPTLQEATTDELRRIYLAAKRISGRWTLKKARSSTRSKA